MTLDHYSADEETRARIRDLLDATLFVEAGAGTGKTRALVDRVVALVRGGRPIERIAAITFTEKAAAELKDRVRGELESYKASEHGEAELITTALQSLDRSQISTIHAFCLNLMRSYSAEARVDPGFEIQDEVMAERRFQERWRYYLERLADDGAAVGAVNRVLDLGLTTADIQKLARELWLNAELAPVLADSPLSAPPATWPDLAAMSARIAALPGNIFGATDALTLGVSRVAHLLERLEKDAWGREALLASSIQTLGQKLGRAGRQDHWGGSTQIALVRDTCADVCAALMGTLTALRSEALAGLLPYVVRFVIEDTRARGIEGKLVFHDLIFRVRDLLRGSTDARIALRRRFDALLIDEFQDTDPLQVEIALAFATDPASGSIDHGRLFLVGDPKQSIYRFRRADMAVYAATRQQVVDSGGTPLDLSLNRRSQRQVIDLVNSLFAPIIGAGSQPQFQPPYHEIHAARAPVQRGPGVAWFGGPPPGWKAKDVRRAEAKMLAAHCHAAVQERWDVSERTGSGEVLRPARFRDIAILVPTRTNLQEIERALNAAAIPYRVEGGSLVLATQEVRDIINCLAAIDDPADEVATVAALRSPAYACSDVEIATYRLDGGSFDYLRSSLDQAEGRVAEALRDLRSFHYDRHKGSLAALAERFISSHALVSIGILDQGGRNSFRRARFVVEQARKFEENGPESLRAFVQWLEQRATGAIRDQEGAGLDDDEDAVRILTIHGAKGLEFPIVFVAGLGARVLPDMSVFLSDRVTGEVVVAIGSKASGRQFVLGDEARLRADENQHAQSERARLLYVAATRARDHLVFSLYHAESVTDSHAALLIMHGVTRLCGELPERDIVFDIDAVTALDGLDVEPSAAPEEFASERERLLTEAVRQRYVSATSLMRLGRDSDTEDKDERRDETEPWSRGRAATRLGRAVHATLQSLSWTAEDPEIDAVAAAQAVAEAIPHQTAEVAWLARVGLASEAASRARQAKRALREVPFALQRGETILEGFIDLVIETDDGLEVVDWKTDRVAPAAVPERLRSYELQAGLYVLGLEEATGLPVRRVTYVFVSAGIERSPGEPAALAAGATRLLDTEP